MGRTGSSDERAFTLLEILVVITVVSLIGTAAALGWPNGRDRARLSQASTWLERMLADLRAQARREGRIRSIEFDVSARRYRHTGAGWRPLPSEVGWSLAPGPATAVTFLPDGTASEVLVTLRAGAFSTTRRVESLTGAIRDVGP